MDAATLKRLIGNLDKKELTKVIGILANASDKAEQKLLDYCQKNAAEENSILGLIKNKNLSVYYDICMEKGKTEEVLVHLKEHPQFNSWQWIDNKHQYSKALASTYPQEIIELYWKEVHYYVSLGKEKNYYHAVSVLREICQIMNKNKWIEDWNRQYQKFLDENHRKKLLIKELEKF